MHIYVHVSLALESTNGVNSVRIWISQSKQYKQRLVVYLFFLCNCNYNLWNFKQNMELCAWSLASDNSVIRVQSKPYYIAQIDAHRRPWLLKRSIQVQCFYRLEFALLWKFVDLQHCLLRFVHLQNTTYSFAFNSNGIYKSLKFQVNVQIITLLFLDLFLFFGSCFVGSEEDPSTTQRVI